MEWERDWEKLIEKDLGDLVAEQIRLESEVEKTHAAAHAVLDAQGMADDEVVRLIMEAAALERELSNTLVAIGHKRVHA